MFPYKRRVVLAPVFGRPKLGSINKNSFVALSRFWLLSRWKGLGESMKNE